MFTLPDLPYQYNALEPYIDEETMRLHHDKHHAAYVEKLNKTLEGHNDILNMSIEDILKKLNDVPEKIQTPVKNFGGGHANHTFFWSIMTGDKNVKPHNNLLTALNATYSSFDTFKQLFNESAVSHFGSGYMWLILDKDILKIMSTSNQDSPLSQGMKPLLVCDLWEHSYYLKYQNRRQEYIDAWWNVINWDIVSTLFAKKDE